MHQYLPGSLQNPCGSVMIIFSISDHSCNSLHLHTCTHHPPSPIYIRHMHTVAFTPIDRRGAAWLVHRPVQCSLSSARPPPQATTKGCPSAHQAARHAGYAKEGGTLKASGSKFELLQEYREFKRGPGGVLLEEIEDAPVRGFDILALTPDTLMLKLATTSYTDEESGRRVTVQPDGDYFLVWTKAGAATQRAPAAVEEEEDEEVRTSRRAAVLHLLLPVGRLPPP